MRLSTVMQLQVVCVFTVFHTGFLRGIVQTQPYTYHLQSGVDLIITADSKKIPSTQAASQTRLGSKKKRIYLLLLLCLYFFLASLSIQIQSFTLPTIIPPHVLLKIREGMQKKFRPQIEPVSMQDRSSIFQSSLLSQQRQCQCWRCIFMHYERSNPFRPFYAL